jgi:uncharacterized protein
MDMKARTGLRWEVVTGLRAVDADDWDRLVSPNDPFTAYAFLRALEDSGSVGRNTGWQPCHVVVRDEWGALVGATPLYSKTHSYGEYIFDWSWAGAAKRSGIPYYPKLVSMAPVTPATGQRLLIEESGRADEIRDELMRGVGAVADRLKASSVHVNFCLPAEREALGRYGYLPRTTYQFHWFNRPDGGYRSFDEFVGLMHAKARNQVKAERRKARAHGLDLSVVRGPALSDADRLALYEMYESTVDKKGGATYLTRSFFTEGLAGPLGESLLAGLARDGAGGEIVAATINYTRGSHLYGRYWGARRDVPFLHFELCYYQLIEWAIDNGITRFEAGAQGEHKIRRGLLPSETSSAHWIRDPMLREAVADWLPREAAQHRSEMSALMDLSPFKAG